MNEIKKLAEIYLEDFKQENGMDIIQYFTNKFDYWNLSEQEFEELEKYITIYRNDNGKRFITLKEHHIKISKRFNLEKEELEEQIKDIAAYAPLKREDFKYKKEYDNYLKEYMRYIQQELSEINYGKRSLFGISIEDLKPTVPYKKIPQIISEALHGKLHEILRECENTFREESGIPKIGEGWVSETNLYYKIREAFPEEKIVHHGRPDWLGKQHLDIYLPERNIALEYQGAQHFEPVEYFGGVEAFKKQQRRDEIKQKLCKENNCILIYVYPDYDLSVIKYKIQQNL